MTSYINGSEFPLSSTEIAACCNWLTERVLHTPFLCLLNSLQAIEYQDLIYGGAKWGKVVENGILYPLGTVWGFEPSVKFSTSFSKNLEISRKMTIPPPIKRALVP